MALRDRPLPLTFQYKMGSTVLLCRPIHTRTFSLLSLPPRLKKDVSESKSPPTQAITKRLRLSG